MDYRQLQIFLAIAESGAYSRAAMKLSISQPILSRQMKTLEDFFGAELFHRTGRGVVPTEAGEVLLQHARKIVGCFDVAIKEVQEAGERPSGPVILSMPASVSEVISVSLLKNFKDAYPNISLKLLEGYSGLLLEWLAEGKTDIAVVYDVSGQQGSLGNLDHFLKDEIFLIGPYEDPAGVGQGPVEASILARLPLILPSRPHGIRILVDEALTARSLKARIFMEINSNHSMLKLVERGVGYAVLPYFCAADLVNKGTVRIWRIQNPTIVRSLSISTSTRRPSTAPVRALSQLLRRAIQDIVDNKGWSPDPSVLS